VLYQLQLLRGACRDWCARTATPLHASLVTRFMEVRARFQLSASVHFNLNFIKHSYLFARSISSHARTKSITLILQLMQRIA
jgi:hypothetical protein